MKTLSEKQKWIYSSSAIALLSMFLPWFVWGMRSDNGWETDYYVLLACWFVPLISAYNHFNWKVINIISLLIGSLALTVFVGDPASITIIGDTYTSKVGAGVYVYLLAWSAAVYSEFMVFNEHWDSSDASGKSMSISTNEELFLQVEKDFENNKIDEALWIKSLTLCDGDKDKAKYKYIRDQVSKIEQEKVNNIKATKTTFLDVDAVEEFIGRLSVSDKNETLDMDEVLKKSKYSMILGVLSVLSIIGMVSLHEYGFLAVILFLGAFSASIGGLVLGVANIKEKQGISKRMSIIGIVMSGLVLALFLSVFVFAA